MTRFARNWYPKMDRTEEQTAKMIGVGGSEWQAHGKHRIYFNDLATFLGLSVNRFNTGNISSAYIDGEKISNTKAREMLSFLSDSKIWFDVDDGEFHHKMGYARRLDREDVVQRVIAAIKAKLEREE